jgi:ElaB/YqjD/DUF883 family membrane-anchored ribosome-binding protein
VKPTWTFGVDVAAVPKVLIGDSYMTQQRADYPLDYTNGTAPAAEPTAKDRIREMADSAGDQLQHVAENAQEIAAKVADQAREYGEKAQKAVEDFKPFVEKSLKDQPMTTLAVAGVIGFALGALWKK